MLPSFSRRDRPGGLAGGRGSLDGQHMKTRGIDKISAVKSLKGLGRALPALFSWLLMCLPVLSLAPVHAEVPVKFTYQGNLRQNGLLISGQRNMVFRVYGSSDSAAELWASPAYDVTLSTGVFRVTLEPALSDWQSGGMWLELEIEGNRMSPREELTSSPYSINSLMLSGKRYTTAAAAPAGATPGDLWYNSVQNAVNYWNGSAWAPTSGSGLPGAHAGTHAGGGADAITSLGTHTVTGYLTVSSSVSAGWYYGDGAGLYNLDASKISTGTLSGDRIGNVIVSTHIADGAVQGQDLADGAVTRAKLNQSGCAVGEILQWDGTQWACAGGAAGGVEVDPLSIHDQDTLQAGTTFYVSSGTVNNLNVNNSLQVTGTTLIKGSQTQAYSLAIGTGTVPQIVISTSGAVGIGTQTPRANLDVTGTQGSGGYIMIFNSGQKMAAWLRNK